MWEYLHNEHTPTSVEQQIAEMRRQLLSISQMERVLMERNAGREAYRYLLEAHTSLAREKFPGKHSPALRQLTAVRVHQSAI